MNSNNELIVEGRCNERKSSIAAHLSQLYDVEEYDRAMDSEVLNRTMWNQMLSLAQENIPMFDGFSVLEIGAGSGLFTKRLIGAFPHASVTVVDPDAEALTHLRDRVQCLLPLDLTLCPIDIRDLANTQRFSLIVSSLADHHIHYQNKRSFFQRVASLLDNGGIFISGDEFIASYESETERRAGLIAYHTYIIKEALHDLNLAEVRVESTALEKGLTCEGEYKTSLDRYFDYVLSSKLCVVHQIRIGPSDSKLEESRAGVYVHVFCHQE